MSHPCACCGYPTLPEGGHASHEICPVCDWEDDPVQNADPRLAGGANRPSLLAARGAFERFGACEPEARSRVRPPTERERAARVRPSSPSPVEAPPSSSGS